MSLRFVNRVRHFLEQLHTNMTDNCLPSSMTQQRHALESAPKASSSMMCTAVQNAISFLWATLLQCGIDIAFRPAHANRLRLPRGFGTDALLDAS